MKINTEYIVSVNRLLQNLKKKLFNLHFIAMTFFIINLTHFTI